ncbi:MAG TPA: phosphotransferase [Gemmatimonadales bacterium]|nr:phosphotransferase [Gemmatimonadales bacterium]
MRSPLVVLAGLAGTMFSRPSQPHSGSKAQPLPTPRPRMRDWRTSTELPDDEAIPAFRAIKTTGVREALQFLNLDAGALEVTLRGYAPGKRATLEVRSGGYRIAVKAYNEPPDDEAQLYTALAGGSGGVRVPRLIGYDRALSVLALEWLEGATLQALIKQGQGRRAGELAAMWPRLVAALDVRFGTHHGVNELTAKTHKYADRMGAADASLGTTASGIVRRLESTQPAEGPTRLVHGSLYDRHMLDMGTGPGLIDWDCFGQGAAELDAAVFLSVIWRSGLRHERRDSSRQAAVAFHECTAGLLDEDALAWHRAATMLRLAHKKVRQRDDDALVSARSLVEEAARLAAAAG